MNLVAQGWISFLYIQNDGDDNNKNKGDDDNDAWWF